MDAVVAKALLPTTRCTSTSRRWGGSSPAQRPMSSAEAPTPLTDGEVRRIEKARNEIVLKHGDLPNLAMPAMTMAFDVADKKMLDDLKVGAKVRFNADLIKGSHRDVHRACPMTWRA